MEIDSINSIRKYYAPKYRKGNCLSALWSLWLRSGMSRRERINHLLVMLEVRAETATENGKTILRKRYIRLSKMKYENNFIKNSA